MKAVANLAAAGDGEKTAAPGSPLVTVREQDETWEKRYTYRT